MPPSREAWVYRAVDPGAIDPISGDVTRAAFVLRANEEELSVYSAAVQTPRGVLQKLIDGLNARLATKEGIDRQRFQEWMNRRGATVERRVELGWRVVELPLFAFTERGFRAGDVEPDGHISIQGSHEEFERFADELPKTVKFVFVE